MQEGLTNLWALQITMVILKVKLKIEYLKMNMVYMIYPIYPHSDYQLQSTPLNHSIIAAMDLVPKFKKDYGLQKVHTVFLTDGASNNIDRKYKWTNKDMRTYSERYDEITVKKFLYQLIMKVK